MALAFHHPRFQSISAGLCAVKKQEEPLKSWDGYFILVENISWLDGKKRMGIDLNFSTEI